MNQETKENARPLTTLLAEFGAKAPSDQVEFLDALSEDEQLALLGTIVNQRQLDAGYEPGGRPRFIGDQPLVKHYHALLDRRAVREDLIASARALATEHEMKATAPPPREPASHRIVKSDDVVILHLSSGFGLDERTVIQPSDAAGRLHLLSFVPREQWDRARDGVTKQIERLRKVDDGYYPNLIEVFELKEVVDLEAIIMRFNVPEQIETVQGETGRPFIRSRTPGRNRLLGGNGLGWFLASVDCPVLLDRWRDNYPKLGPDADEIVYGHSRINDKYVQIPIELSRRIHDLPSTFVPTLHRLRPATMAPSVYKASRDRFWAAVEAGDSIAYADIEADELAKHEAALEAERAEIRERNARVLAGVRGS